MGKLAVYKYFSFLFLIASVILTGFTLFGLIGGYVSPAGNNALALLVYALPIIIAANSLLLIYWLVRRRWYWAPIPLVALLCSIPYIGTIVQLRSEPVGVDAKPGLKIATYNVAMFGRETTGFMAQDILATMKKQKVDVLCLQEYNSVSGDKNNTENYKEYFPYATNGAGDMIIFSRYPITDSEAIPFEHSSNSALWADIDVRGHKLRIVNAHLQTTGINSALHQASKRVMQGIDEGNQNWLMRTLYGNYTTGMMVRSHQAELMAGIMKESPNPIILCGDFNDVPYSYVYRTMKGDLVDGFKECGSGWMYTYRGKKMFRIDYIFHDPSLEGITYYKQDITYSDHYPVFMKIAI